MRQKTSHEGQLKSEENGFYSENIIIELRDFKTTQGRNYVAATCHTL